ncbi:MAG: response regulator transcription factor [Clostridiales bacterium]|nr:response regulator transcription factor [Clostridiales bacterium]
MPKATILICDDTIAVHQSLTIYLKEEGFDSVSAYTGKDALQIFHTRKINLIVLDIMLPDMSGRDICREIRRASNVPIIMLSAKSEEIDRIVGLELGADDYMAKPFSPRELSIKVRNLLRRADSQVPASAKSTFCELEAYPDSMEIYVNGEKLPLTPKECKVMLYLIKNAKHVLTRDQILNAVWGYEYYDDVRVVDTLMKRIRKKLPTEGVHFVIRSVYGVGYKLEELP